MLVCLGLLLIRNGVCALKKHWSTHKAYIFLSVSLRTNTHTCTCREIKNTRNLVFDRNVCVFWIQVVPWRCPFISFILTLLAVSLTEHNDKCCQDIAVMIVVTLFWASITLAHTLKVMRGVFMIQTSITERRVWGVNISRIISLNITNHTLTINTLNKDKTYTH